MPFQKIEIEENADIVGEDSDPSAEEVSELHAQLGEATDEKRIDVLEDMLDIMNER